MSNAELLGPSVFRSSELWPGASGALKRAMVNASLLTPSKAVLKIIEACKLAKVSYDSPVYQTEKPECWAHVGIPSQNIAIYIVNKLEYAKVRAWRAAWESHGWRLVDIRHDDVTGIPADTLASHLRAAIADMAGGKKR